MAKNECGFMSTRYPQPDYYTKIFDNYNAVYIHPKTDKVYMIEVELKSYFGIVPPNSSVIGYSVLRQDNDCRRQLLPTVKTQKAAVNFLRELGVIV